MNIHKKQLASLAAAACLMGSLNSNVSAASIPPTPLISRGVPAYASSDTASAANDNNYRTVWRGAAPGWIAYDLSSVPAAQRGKAILAWYSDSYDYDPTIKTRPSYGLLKDYIIEGNKAAGGKLPKSGWTTLASVTGNIYHSRQHVIDLTGCNWVRVSVKSVDNAGGKNASVNIDVHSIKDGALDDWIVYGDSITAGSGNFSGSPYGPSGQIVHAANPDYYPIFECGGTGSIFSKDGVEKIEEWLSVFPGHYVGLAFGTNDSWGNNKKMEKYYNNMETIVNKVLASGRIPVVSKIPWAAEPGVANNAPLYNEKVDALYRACPKVMKGPDFWSIFQGKRELLGPDGVHPSPKGYGVMRAEWAKTMLSIERQGTAAPVTEALAKAAWSNNTTTEQAAASNSVLPAADATLPKAERIKKENARHEAAMKQQTGETTSSWQDRQRSENELHEIELQKIKHSNK
jgi:lysophospholipase L1-like esterase